jgi:hypothetical protein
VYYIKSKKRNGLTRTLEQHEDRTAAEARIYELEARYPEPDWDLWVSTQASFEWLQRHGQRSKARKAHWGYSRRRK